MSLKNKAASSIDSTIGLMNHYAPHMSKALDSHAIISVTDSEGNITYANNKFIEVSGYSLNELLGKKHNILKSGKYTKQFYEKLWNTISSGETWEGIIENRKKDSSHYWVKTTISPFGKVNEAPEGYISLRTEITELEFTKVAYKKTLRVLDVNSAVNHLLNHSADEQKLLQDICEVLINQADYKMTWIGYIINDERKAINCMAVAGAEGNYIEKAHLSYDNSDRGNGPAGTAIKKSKTVVVYDVETDPSFSPWLADARNHGYRSMVAIPLMHDDGKAPFGVLLCYSENLNTFDKLEVKLLEEAARELTFSLQHFKIMQENERLEKQLHHAQKMEAVGQLSSGIAHDFNNILASIIGYTDLAIRKLDPKEEKLHRFLNEVYVAGNRARDLIKQMLIFSRSDELKTEDVGSVDVVPLSKEIIKVLRSSLPSSMEINIQTEHDNHALYCHLDPMSLQNIITNLLVNARDAIHGKGEVLVKLTSQKMNHAKCNSCHQTFDGEYNIIQITDNGSGVDDKTIDMIFESSFTTKEEGKGSGQGLATVHSLVHELGGHIIVTGSQPGACFSIYLPQAPNQKQTSSIHRQSLSINDDSPLMNVHALVVDDEASIVGILQNLLPIWGMKVTGCISSEDALTLIEQDASQFDILISDQTMPKITGIELAEKYRNLIQDIPVLIASGYSDKINAETAKQMGFGFISKPFEPNEIYEKLLEVWRGKNE